MYYILWIRNLFLTKDLLILLQGLTSLRIIAKLNRLKAVLAEHMTKPVSGWQNKLASLQVLLANGTTMLFNQI